MTYATRYNAAVDTLMPHFAKCLKVNASIDCPLIIDEIIFRDSEYMGGMCAVICAVVNQQDKADAETRK